MSWLTPPRLRAALAALVAADLLSYGYFIAAARAVALADGIAMSPFAALISRPAVAWPLALLGVAGALAFGRRAGQLLAGLLPLAALMLLSTAHGELFGSPWRHLYFSGLCLAGWLLGLAVARWRDAPDAEGWAQVGATALLGAAYFNAGLSKLLYGGTDWLSGFPIQAVVIGQDGMVADDLLTSYRIWVVGVPGLAALFASSTVAFELAGALMISGQRVRRWVAIGLIAMHTNILLLTHILYWESMVVLLLFGFAPDPPPAAATIAGARRGRGFALAAGLLALGAILAIAHQARRHAHSPSPPAAPASAPVAAPDPTAPGPRAARRIGPLALGQELDAGWVVDALRLTDDGFVVGASAAPGRADFEITCAVSERRSPFDVEAAHIFYSSPLPFESLAPAGRALQRQISAAASGREICDALREWCQRAG